MGDRTRSLLQGLDWVVSASLISRLLVGGTTLVIARKLGAAAFGEANVSLALALWIQIPMLISLQTAVVHYLPQSSMDEKSSWISTALGLQLVFMVLTLSIGWFARETWCALFRIPSPYFLGALLWCTGYLLFSAITSVFSALEKFRARAFSEILFAMVFPLLIVGWSTDGNLNALRYIHSLGATYAGVGLIGLVVLMAKVNVFAFSPSRISPLMRFALLASLGSLVNALLHSPGRLIANRFLSMSEVGVLSAYQSASIQIALFFLAAVSQVFFPIASRTPDPAALLVKIKKFLLQSAPVLFILQIALTACLFKLLGRGYPLYLQETVLFSLAAVMVFAYGLLAWFLVSCGIRLMLLSFLCGILAGASNLLLSWMLIPSLGIRGAGLAMVLSPILGIALSWLVAKRFIPPCGSH